MKTPMGRRRRHLIIPIPKIALWLKTMMMKRKNMTMTTLKTDNTTKRKIMTITMAITQKSILIQEFLLDLKAMIALVPALAPVFR